MDWFEKLTGFKESSYAETQQKLFFAESELYCPDNGKRYDLGQFEMPSLKELRQRVAELSHAESHNEQGKELRFNFLHADAYHLHAHESANNSVIQVASQFNLLEMPGMHVTPEDGVTNYQFDKTQGPASAMAAGPATLFRNYGLNLGTQQGQTKSLQINTLAELAFELGDEGLEMINGYAQCDRDFLERIKPRLSNCGLIEREALKGLLKVGVHWKTTVTAKGAKPEQKVTQVFCSALPMAYNRVQDRDLWEPFARLVLEALYEATFCVGVLNSHASGNNKLYLTQVGGGVFGNPVEWIAASIQQQMRRFKGSNIHPHLVVRGHPNFSKDQFV